jgi:hypothetical protein
LSELNDLASSFGLPAVAVAIAGSIYAALSKAEEVARLEALQEVSTILKDPSRPRSVRPSSIIATFIMLILLLVVHASDTSLAWSMGTDVIIYYWQWAAYCILSSFMPDYFALLQNPLGP